MSHHQLDVAIVSFLRSLINHAVSPGVIEDNKPLLDATDAITIFIACEIAYKIGSVQSPLYRTPVRPEGRGGEWGIKTFLITHLYLKSYTVES